MDSKTVVHLVKSGVAAGATNTLRPLTHSPDDTREGLAVDATHIPEEWRTIPGYEGFYEASNHGRVRSLPRMETQRNGRVRRRAGKIMSLEWGGPNRDYLRCPLNRNGETRRFSVHTLVCLTFNGPKPSPGHEIRHLNGNPSDNRAENLAWGTHSENMLDKVAHGTHHEAAKTHCVRGHEYAGNNLTIARNGSRRCKACNRFREQSVKDRANPGRRCGVCSFPRNGTACDFGRTHSPADEPYYPISPAPRPYTLDQETA